MFSTNFNASSTLSSMSQTLDVARSKNAARQYDYEKFNEFVKKAAADLITDFAKFKMILDSTVTIYLRELEGTLFHRQGYKRALILQSAIANSMNTSQLIPALEEAIKSGNEDEKSLKTYLFKNINTNFFDNKLTQIYPFTYYGYQEILTTLFREIRNQLKPINLTTFTEDAVAPNMAIKTL